MPVLILRPLAILLTAVLLHGGAAHAAETGDLQGLRERALELVNESRREHDLAPLELGPALNEAAQAHADDMLRRDYYAHRSPEGGTVMDRYVRAGGSEWEVAAENIARCADCDPPPTIDRIEELHEGWMNSPEHRQNILARGIARFGFGITVGEEEGLYAVQTFAGPGEPRGLDAGEQAKSLSPQEQAELALDLINEARKEARAPALEASPPLNEAADGLVPDNADPDALESGDLFEAIPQESRAEWQSVSAVSGVCGGCGTEPTDVDVRFFVRDWFASDRHRETLLNPGFTHLGFTMAANGEGRKAALTLLAGRR